MRHLIFSLLATWLALTASVPTARAESTLIFGGQICAAINPRQAQQMEWRETYLINRSEDKNYFVACPILRVAADTSIYAAIGLINESDANVDILCVYREVTPTGDIARRFSDINIQLAPGASDAAVLDNAPVSAPENMFSVVCRLPPDTGVTVLAQTLQTS